MRTASEQKTGPELIELMEEAKLGTARRRRRLMAAGVVALVAVGAVLVFSGGKEPAVRFETAPVERADLEVTISATGKLKGWNTVEVGAEVSGKVIEVLVEHNSRVERGQLMARIDPERFRAAVEQAEARVAAAEAAVLQAEATLREAELKRKRGEEQDREGLIAKQELETLRATAVRAKASLNSARAEARLAQANLVSARTDLDRTEIRSPIDGLVLSRLVEPGQTVTAGFQTPVLFKVTDDLTRMRLHAEVDESDVGKVQPGQKARFTVDAWPERVFEAEVVTVYNEPIEDQTVVAYEAVLSVDNSERLLRPGMTATATIVVDERRNALVVPNAALRFAPPAASTVRIRAPIPGVGGPPGPPRGSQDAQKPPAGPRVWVEDGAGGLRPVAVKVVATDGQRSEVESSELQEGMRVVVDLAEAV